MFSLFTVASATTALDKGLIRAPRVLEVNESDISQLLTSNEYVVVYRTSRYNTQSFQPFMEAQTLFDSSITFVIVYDNCLPKLEFFKNQKLFVSYSPVFDESTMLLCMDMALNHDYVESTNIQDVYAHFGQTAFTIIGPIEESTKIVELAYSVPCNLGICNFVFASNGILHKFGISKFGVYHKIDSDIVAFDGSEKGLLSALKAKFDYMTFESMQRSEKPIFLLLRDNIHENHTTFMGNLVEKYPDFEYAFVKGDDVAKIGQFTHLYPPFTYNSRLLILNMTGGYFFNSEELIGDELKNQYFEIDLWMNVAEKFINLVKDSKINKTYKSEYVPRANSLNLTKVVGYNYNDFLNETENDIIMYYVIDNAECRKIFDAYVQFSNSIKGKFKCKVGFIDVDQNAIENGFPVKPSEVPKVAFIDHKDKSMRFMERKIDYENLMNFAKENCNTISDEL